MVELASVHFLVVGAGGLGCPALLGLSAAGARRFTVVDPDLVEASNLQRQVLYSTAEIGMTKVSAARWTLAGRVPEIGVDVRQIRLGAASLDQMVAGLTEPAVVLECTDDPPLKFAANDACLRHGVPLVVGAAVGWQGQVMAVRPGAACYRCVYEEAPQRAQTCAGVGVIGPVVGTIGAMMVAHALALAEQRDETAGALTTFDGLRGVSRRLQPAVRGDCPAHRATSPSSLAAC